MKFLVVTMTMTMAVEKESDVQRILDTWLETKCSFGFRKWRVRRLRARHHDLHTEIIYRLNMNSADLTVMTHGETIIRGLDTVCTCSFSSCSIGYVISCIVFTT